MRNEEEAQRYSRETHRLRQLAEDLEDVLDKSEIKGSEYTIMDMAKDFDITVLSVIRLCDDMN